jgi:hypothetical protein
VPWFKVDGYFFSSPGVLEAGNAAVGLYVRAGSWSAGYDTSGFVPVDFVKRYGTSTQAKALIQAGLWEATAGGYQMTASANWAIALEAPRRMGIPQQVRELIYRRDGYLCVECLRPDDLTLDHIYPWSLGGSDDPSNLRTLCRPCNSRKGARV